MKILGVIPARGGSKEVPRKNLLKLGGKSLIQIAFDSAKESKYLNKIILSSDDEEIIDIGKKIGCETPFVRPKSLSTDNASSIDVLRHSFDWFVINKSWAADIVVCLQPTTPFRNGNHIDGVIELLLEKNADAALTVTKPNYPPHWMFAMDRNFKIKNLFKNGNKFLRRQDTPNVYQPAGLVFAFKSKTLKAIKTILPYKDTRGFLIKNEDAINIDSFLDYYIAKAIFEEKKN